MSVPITYAFILLAISCLLFSIPFIIKKIDRYLGNTHQPYSYMTCLVECCIILGALLWLASMVLFIRYI